MHQIIDVQVVIESSRSIAGGVVGIAEGGRPSKCMRNTRAGCGRMGRRICVYAMVQDVEALAARLGDNAEHGLEADEAIGLQVTKSCEASGRSQLE